MAWYNGGNWEGLRISEAGPYIWSQLCCAINEREQLLGRGTPNDEWCPWGEAIGEQEWQNEDDFEPLTKWITASGEKTFPDPVDFHGMLIRSVDMLTNFERMKTALGRGHAETIEGVELASGLCDCNSLYASVLGWYEDSEYHYGSFADIIAGTEYEDAESGFVSITDVRPLLLIRDALNKLQFILWFMRSGRPYNSIDGPEVGTLSYDLEEDVWHDYSAEEYTDDEMAEVEWAAKALDGSRAADSASSGTSFYVETGGYYEARRRYVEGAGLGPPSDYFIGVWVSARVAIVVPGTGCKLKSGVSFEISDSTSGASMTFDESYNDGATPFWTVLVDVSDWPNIGSTTPGHVVSCAWPESSPLDIDALNPNATSAGIGGAQSRLWTDISGELTYG